MIKARITLQSFLLSSYLGLFFTMIAGIIYGCVLPQKSEILPASLCAIIFIICFISGIFNVFYYKKVSKKLYKTFMFYLILPISIPLIILETKYYIKINNQDDLFFKASKFLKTFVIITSILQVIELTLIMNFIFLLLLSNSHDLKIIGWLFFIPFVLILFGIVSSLLYFGTGKKVFKVMMIFNVQFGLPLFFLNFIISNNDKK